MPRYGGRAYVKFDKYAMPQAGREHMLTSSELLLLIALVNRTDEHPGPEGHVWRGTKDELREWTLQSPTTITRCIERLDEKGCVTIRQPFSRNGQAVVLVKAYESFVVPTRRFSAAPRPQGTRELDQRFEPDSRTSLAEDVQDWSSHQGKVNISRLAVKGNDGEWEGLERGEEGVFDPDLPPPWDEAAAG